LFGWTGVLGKRIQNAVTDRICSRKSVCRMQVKAFYTLKIRRPADSFFQQVLQHSRLFEGRSIFWRKEAVPLSDISTMSLAERYGERIVMLELPVHLFDPALRFHAIDLFRKKRAGEPEEGGEGFPVNERMDAHHLGIAVRTAALDGEQTSRRSSKLLGDNPLIV